MSGLTTALGGLLQAGTAAFSPTDIAGLEFWVKADGLSLSDNDPVTSWTDFSGNANHATQATSGSKPLFKTNILNGKPVIRFDGTDDFMVANTFSISTCSIFLVLNPSSTGIQQIFIQWGNVSDATQLTFHYWMNDLAKLGCFFSDSSGAAMQASQPGSGATGWQYGGAIFNTSPTFYLAGTPGAPASSNGTLHTSTSKVGVGVKVDSSGNTSVGETNFFAGDIAEIIVYDSALSSTDRADIETYIASKYAL